MTVTRKRPLNIGLDKMLSKATASIAPSPVAGDQLRQVPIELMQRGQYQPRHEFVQESLQELADSIKAQGILQPIVLRQIRPQQYEIIAGERRWRAAQLAGLTHVPAIIKEISDEAALAMALIENIQRENLNALEEARALHRLLEEFHLTHEEVAKSVGKSRVTVSNLLRLLQLEDHVKTLLERGDIDMGHARALLALPLNQQRAAAKEIVDRGLSVREAEGLVKHLLAGAGVTASSKKVKLNPDMANLQRSLSEKFGTKVSFQHRKSGSGKLVIEYTNLDILDGILQKLN
ncbi:MAG: chromosome partitioning protein ParB [Gammaproteobacteria bacterium]|jgi:ParB family chromosome partitioning protein|nr:chromosome partitioning protein ParB [Gammaproteobacteria bacterium]